MVISIIILVLSLSRYLLQLANGYPNGYAFIMSFTAPLWTICMRQNILCCDQGFELSSQVASIPQYTSAKKLQMPQSPFLGQLFVLLEYQVSLDGVCCHYV